MFNQLNLNNMPHSTIPSITSNTFKVWMKHQMKADPEAAGTFNDHDWYSIFIIGFNELK